MSKANHVAVWFEIPVSDLDRAAKFYSEVLGVKLDLVEFGPHKMAIFPAGGDGSEMVVHGALVRGDGYVPGDTGPILYLNGGDDLAGPLSRVESAGGTVLQPKTSIGQHGFMAIFHDTEGNRLALYSAS